MRSILSYVGIGLLLLAAASGVALFVKALAPAKSAGDDGRSTLWGLFIFGLIAGLILLSIGFRA